jgi:SAM-dependent methyltransferase
LSQAQPVDQSVRIPCPICLSSSGALLWRVSNNEVEKPIQFDVVRCDKCGLTYTSPMPSLDQLMPFYNSGVYAKDERPALRLADRTLSVLADMRLREIEDWKRPGRLLDVGAGKGRFVRRARMRGWTAIGVEPMPGSVRLARSRYEIDLVERTLIDAQLPARSFDVLTMWHAMEHIPDPLAELHEVSRVLADDGLLILEVPNLASFQAWIGQDDWFHLMPPHHLVHYTPHTLRAVLANAGFEVLRLHSFSPEHGPFGMLQTALNRLGGERNFLYHRLKRVPYRYRHWRLVGSMLQTVVVGAIAILPATGLELAASVARRGAVIRMFARKKM